MKTTNNTPATIGNADELRELRDALAAANDTETPEPFAAHITAHTLGAFGLMREQLADDCAQLRKAYRNNAPAYVDGQHCNPYLLLTLLGAIRDTLDVLDDFIEACPERCNAERRQRIQADTAAIARDLLHFSLNL